MKSKLDIKGSRIRAIEDDKEICFYDTRYIDPGFQQWKNGQFIASYYIKTLLKDREQLERKGLNLYANEPEWKISGEEMKEVFNWLYNKQLNKRGEK
jgi:hypothetical protein